MLVYDMVESKIIREAEHVSSQMASFPRDLLQRFISRDRLPSKFEDKTHDGEEELELGLGLSLNGRFGVDPERAKKLNRSSSVSNFNSTDESTASSVRVPEYAPIPRTCSLPTETKEVWRKRKELQSLRRMEAKRKRLDKIKNVRVVRDRVSLEENGGGLVPINGNGELSKSLGTASWVSGGEGGAVCGHEVKSKGDRGSGLSGGCGGSEGLYPLHPSSQGSIGSQGSGSSVISDIESQPIRGTNRCTEVRSPAGFKCLPEQRPVTPETRNDARGKLAGAAMAKVAVADKEANERMRNMMVDMPCVSTRGHGPNGKRTEGFLYRYRKGEEVRIVCVCHGTFLSPAEFVKHAGGGDVVQPLKHIVVNPFPFL